MAGAMFLQSKVSKPTKADKIRQPASKQPKKEQNHDPIVVKDWVGIAEELMVVEEVAQVSMDVLE